MADQTDSFLREIQEDIRREQLAQIWARYGSYIIAAAVLLVAAVGAYKYMEYRRNSAAQQAALRYEAAVRLSSEGKGAESQKALEQIAENAPAGYAALARIRLAGDLAKAGKTAEAVSAYETLSKDSRLDGLLRDYAALQAAWLRVDAADWTEMQNRLNDLTNDKNPWRASARELLALSAYKAGKLDDARKLYEQLLGDRSTPPSLVERSQMMLAVLAEAETAKAGDLTPSSAGRAATEKPEGVPAKK